MDPVGQLDGRCTLQGVTAGSERQSKHQHATNNHKSTGSRCFQSKGPGENNGEKGDLSKKSKACMHDHTWLRPALPKLPLHFTLRSAHCNAYAMVRQREKCVTGIVRKPFGGGGAFVVAEGHGTDGTSSVLGFDLLQISSSPTHARLPGREEPGEPVQALSQTHSRKGLR